MSLRAGSAVPAFSNASFALCLGWSLPNHLSHQACEAGTQGNGIPKGGWRPPTQQTRREGKNHPSYILLPPQRRSAPGDAVLLIHFLSSAFRRSQKARGLKIITNGSDFFQPFEGWGGHTQPRQPSECLWGEAGLKHDCNWKWLKAMKVKLGYSSHSFRWWFYKPNIVCPWSDIYALSKKSQLFQSFIVRKMDHQTVYLFQHWWCMFLVSN